ncbi:hypothetical protein NDU88_005233 [Pleurodeles waltl]|uniref:Uncharacterized protein n=1 Tax=Pleurodeles waltl TaxID=8319 RepID=A0AAV7NQX4_PLEWA|nr:hypothetical protein NDU88_005233 [Pleurodeles waltl]
MKRGLAAGLTKDPGVTPLKRNVVHEATDRYFELSPQLCVLDLPEHAVDQKATDGFLDLALTLVRRQIIMSYKSAWGLDINRSGLARWVDCEREALHIEEARGLLKVPIQPAWDAMINVFSSSES